MTCVHEALGFVESGFGESGQAVDHLLADAFDAVLALGGLDISLVSVPLLAALSMVLLDMAAVVPFRA